MTSPISELLEVPDAPITTLDDELNSAKALDEDELSEDKEDWLLKDDEEDDDEDQELPELLELSLMDDGDEELDAEELLDRLVF